MLTYIKEREREGERGKERGVAEERERERVRETDRGGGRSTEEKNERSEATHN